MYVADRWEPIVNDDVDNVEEEEENTEEDEEAEIDHLMK